ncbi:hypothetical protein [Paraglaciecola sp. L3A3]|uniref:alpha/beta hydrolase family protein n=1 Tax=Paraglaciecola sp. L3A3 TaxID=2686358 RepID=UPI001E4C0AA9|nr:hypothetical protein [Paraglaciecola sp. L3A3]
MLQKMCFLLFLGCTSSLAKTVSTELDFFDADRERPVKVRFWYQSSGNCDEKLCIATDSSNQKMPVAVLSHGAFGSPREMNWLGYSLASQGWLVAGVAHYQESWVYGTETIEHSSVSKPWLRAQDVSFVLDTLLLNNLSDALVDDENIIAIGHSSGGYTALSLVGADLNFIGMQNYCAKFIAKDIGCRYGSAKNNKPTTNIDVTKVTDPRIRAVIALDPALGPAVTKSALNKINVPVLIAGSVNNDFLIFEHHAKYYSENIPKAELIEVGSGAGHFVYLDKCEHQHKAMGVSLCADREGVDRQEVQQELVRKILNFVVHI